MFIFNFVVDARPASHQAAHSRKVSSVISIIQLLAVILLVTHDLDGRQIERQRQTELFRSWRVVARLSLIV